MKKEILTGAIVTTGFLVTGTFESNVSANEVDTNVEMSNVPVAQTGLEEKVATTEGKLNSQKKELQSLEDQVATEQKNVDSATVNLKQKEGYVKQAQENVVNAEKNLNEATEENISNTKLSIEKQEKNITNTQQKVDKAQNDVNFATDLANSTQNDVANTKNEVTKQQSIVKDAEKKVVAAENLVNNTDRQGTIDKVNNAKKKVNTDLENISSVKSNMDKEQKNINKLTDTQTSLKADIENTSAYIDQEQKNVNKLASELNSAQKNTNNKKVQVKSAQENLSLKEEALNNKNAENIQAELDSSKKELEESKANFDYKKQKLLDVSAQVDSYKSKIKDLTEKTKSAESIVDKNTQLVDIAEKNKTLLHSEKESAQKKLSGLQDQLNNLQTKAVPKIEFTEDQIMATKSLVEALRKYGDLGGNNIPSNALQGYNWGDASIENIKKLKDIWGKSMTDPKQIQSWKDENVADRNTVVNLDSLTLEQATELSNFVATLLNQARDSLGISEFVGTVEVSSGSVNLALVVARETVSDHWKYFNHDAFAVNKSVADFGLPAPSNTKPGQTNQSYENASFSYIKPTMASLKENIYSMIQSMLFNDYTDDGNDMGNMGHAILNLGLRNIKNSATASPKTYLGVSNNRLATNSGSLSNTSYTHYVFISPDQYSLENSLQKKSGIFNTLDNPYQKLAADLSAAKNNLDSQNEIVRNLNEREYNIQLDVENATNILDHSKVVLENVAKSLERAQLLYKDAEKNKNIAEQEFSNAQKKVDDDENKVLQAKKALGNYDDAVQEMLREVTLAQNDLAGKQLELSKLQKIENEKTEKYNSSVLSLEQLKSDLEVKNKVYLQLSGKIDEANKHIRGLADKLKEFNNLLIVDRENLNSAILTLKNYEKSSEEKLNILNRMKENLSSEIESLEEKVTANKTALAAYNKQKSNLSQKENELASVSEQLREQYEVLQLLKNKLYVLEHAPELLTDAKSKLKQAVSDYNDAKSIYDEAVVSLNYKRGLLTDKKVRVHEIEEELESQKIVLSMLNSTELNEIKISTPKTDSELSELKNYHHFAGEGSKVRESSENSYGMLPQLNDRSSKNTPLEGLLLLLSSLGLAFFNRKQAKKYSK